MSAVAQRVDFWPIIGLNYPDFGEIRARPRTKGWHKKRARAGPWRLYSYTESWSSAVPRTVLKVFGGGWLEYGFSVHLWS